MNKKEEELFFKLTDEIAVSVLRKLCEDKGVRSKIVKLAESELRKIDVEDIADSVFCELNGIEVEDLWDNSGSTRDGYVEPSELAHEMVEEVVEPFKDDIVKYRDLKMKEEEKKACIGLIRGLMRYEYEGGNEFKDWIPDSIRDIAQWTVDEYAKHNTEEDTESVRAEMRND